MTQPTDMPERNPAHTIELHPEETPSKAVIGAVAELTSQSPLEMKRLAEVIDPVALDAFITSADETTSSVTATFDYCGCHVIVTLNEIQIYR